MFNIDKSLKNIIGTKKSSNNMFGRTNNVVNNMLNKTQYKPASPRMQMQWKSFSTPMKNQMRQKYKDSDGDRIPNRWDCQPNNPAYTMAFKYPSEQEMKNQGVKRAETKKPISLVGS